MTAVPVATSGAPDPLQAESGPVHAESGYSLVDCDVHPIMKGGLGDLRPFLTTAAQHRLGIDGRRGLTTSGQREAVSIPRNLLYVNPAGGLRRGAPRPHRT